MVSGNWSNWFISKFSSLEKYHSFGIQPPIVGGFWESESIVRSQLSKVLVPSLFLFQTYVGNTANVYPERLLKCGCCDPKDKVLKKYMVILFRREDFQNWLYQSWVIYIGVHWPNLRQSVGNGGTWLTCLQLFFSKIVEVILCRIHGGENWDLKEVGVMLASVIFWYFWWALELKGSELRY